MSQQKKIYQFLKHQLLNRHFFAISSPFRALPNFIVIGVKRCGTTTLYQQLSDHPSIIRSFQDNIGFFNNNFELGINYYKSFFPMLWHRKKTISNNYDLITYDVTSSYIQNPKTAKNIFHTLPNVKFILMVRNPVDRAYSEYNLGIKIGFETRTFEQAIDEEITRVRKIDEEIQNGEKLDKFSTLERHYLRKGMYAEQLKPWLEIFPKEQFLILSSEELEKEPQRTFNNIFQFLSLKKFSIKNTLRLRKGDYLPMKSETRKMLLNYFSRHNEEFFKLIDKSFEWNF